MRLFLDAHISGKKVGRALRQAGHDVRTADDPALEGWEDRELFELATLENRILVTSNAKHFVPLAQRWIDAGRAHAGLILLPPTLRHEHFGKIISRVGSKLSSTTQEDWGTAQSGPNSGVRKEVDPACRRRMPGKIYRAFKPFRAVRESVSTSRDQC